MGSALFRNRYWFYKSLYDDYIGRDFKLALGLSFFLWMPHYWYCFAHVKDRHIAQQGSRRELVPQKLFC